jgi:putative oxidoreductase
MSTMADVQEMSRSNTVVDSSAGQSVLLSLVKTDAVAAPALLRVTLALVIWPHGAQHLLGWFGGYGFAGTHAWMTGDVGIPGFLATAAILTEFLAPLALLAGAGGRIAALGLAVLMGVAATTHASSGFFMNWSGTLPAGAEGYEYHLLAMAMALAVTLQGSGAWSVDRVLMRRAGAYGAGSDSVGGVG